MTSTVTDETFSNLAIKILPLKLVFSDSVLLLQIWSSMCFQLFFLMLYFTTLSLLLYLLFTLSFGCSCPLFTGYSISFLCFPQVSRTLFILFCLSSTVFLHVYGSNYFIILIRLLAVSSST